LRNNFRSVFVALLNLSFLGAGHLAVGRARRFFVPLTGLTILYVIFGVLGKMSDFRFFAPLALCFVFLYGASIIDAFAIQKRGESCKCWYSKWYFLLFWCFAFSGYQLYNDFIRENFFGYMTVTVSGLGRIMLPAVRSTDYLLVDTFAYRAHPPSIGDVVSVDDSISGNTYLRRIARSDASGRFHFSCDNASTEEPCLQVAPSFASSIQGKVRYVYMSRDTSRIGQEVK
jgi:hypothetical protein